MYVIPTAEDEYSVYEAAVSDVVAALQGTLVLGALAARRVVQQPQGATGTGLAAERVQFRIESFPLSETPPSTDTWSIVASSATRALTDVTTDLKAELSPIQQVLRSSPQDSSSLMIAVRHNSTGQQLLAVAMPWPADRPASELQVSCKKQRDWHETGTWPVNHFIGSTASSYFKSRRQDMNECMLHT